MPAIDRLSQYIRAKRKELANKVARLEAAHKKGDAHPETELQDARIRLKRLETYRRVVDGERQCFHCWTKEGIRSDAVPVNSPPDEELYQCPRCRRTMSEPA